MGNMSFVGKPTDKEVPLTSRIPLLMAIAAIALALVSLATSHAEKVTANDLSGKWYVIASSSIPFQDGSVEFSPDGKMITSWSATTSQAAAARTTMPA